MKKKDDKARYPLIMFLIFMLSLLSIVYCSTAEAVDFGVFKLDKVVWGTDTVPAIFPRMFRDTMPILIVNSQGDTVGLRNWYGTLQYSNYPVSASSWLGVGTGGGGAGSDTTIWGRDIDTTGIYADNGKILKYNTSANEWQIGDDVGAAGGSVDSLSIYNTAGTDSIDNIATGIRILAGTGLTITLDGDSATIATTLGEAITTGEITDGEVKSADIGVDAVGASQIATNAVGSSEIEADAVTTDEIADATILSIDISPNAVTTTRINTDAVTTNEILDATVGAADLANPSVDTDELYANAVGEAEIDWGGGGNQVSATDMSDFGTMTATDDNILVADGTDFESVAMSGDATINNGVIDVTLDSTDFADNSLQHKDLDIYNDTADALVLGVTTNGLEWISNDVGAESDPTLTDDDSAKIGSGVDADPYLVFDASVGDEGILKWEQGTDRLSITGSYKADEDVYADGDIEIDLDDDANGLITFHSDANSRISHLRTPDYFHFTDSIQGTNFTGTGYLDIPTIKVTSEYTLPTADGATDQVIKTNGSGVLSWYSPTAGLWVADTDTTYRLSGTDTIVRFESGADTAKWTVGDGQYTNLSIIGPSDTVIAGFMKIDTLLTTTITNLQGTVWPVDSGSDGQVLTTDGDGIASWTTTGVGDMTEAEYTVGGAADMVDLDNGGLDTNLSSWSGLIGVDANDAQQVTSKADMEALIGDPDLALASGDVYTGTADFSGGSVTFAAGEIIGADILGNVITASHIQADAIETSELKNDAVTSAKIDDSTITGADIDDASNLNVTSATLSVITIPHGTFKFGDTTGADGPNLWLVHVENDGGAAYDSTNPGNSAGEIDFMMIEKDGDTTQAAKILGKVDDTTNNSVDGSLEFWTTLNGTGTVGMTLDSANNLAVVGGLTTNGGKTETGNKHFRATIIDPNSLYDTDAEVCIVPVTEADLTITRIDVTCDANPTAQLDFDLKYASDFINKTNDTIVDELNTTAGVTTITAGFDDATVGAGNCVYLLFNADPHADIKQVSIDVTYDFD